MYWYDLICLLCRLEWLVRTFLGRGVGNVDRTAASWAHHIENPKNSRSNLPVGKIAVVLKVNSKAGWYISSLVGP